MPLAQLLGKGQIAWSVAYRAYGNLAVAFVESVPQPLRFQGQYFDAESGLHYNRYRYYSPETARFITPDPIGLAGGLNQTQYVPNPTGWVDPLGLAGVPCDDLMASSPMKQRVLDNIESSKAARELSNMGGLPPQPGDRTREGFMKNHVSQDRETGLYTKSPGFNNNNGNVGG